MRVGNLLWQHPEAVNLVLALAILAVVLFSKVTVQ